jgi:hypothetical protein
MTVSPISQHNYQDLIRPTVKKRHLEIYDLISASGSEGITSKEICETLGKLPHQISGRFSEMVALDLIIVDRWVKIGKSTYGVWIKKEVGKQTSIF